MRMLRTVFLAVFSLAVMLISCPVFAADEPFVIAVDQGDPPFMYALSGKAEGIYPRLLQAVFERMGAPVEVKAFPWKRAFLLSKDGRVAIGGLYKTSERLEVFDYSAPLLVETLRIYVKKGSEFAFRDVADLKGKKVGIILGWSYGEAFDQAKADGVFQVEEVTAEELNFTKLVLGRVDCVIAPELSANILLAQHNFRERFIALPQPLTENATYLAIAKIAGKQALLEQFNAALEAMKADGTHDKIVSDALAALTP